MLVKIKENGYVNADYMVSLQLVKPGLVEGLPTGRKLPSMSTFKLIALMIDGKAKILLEFKTKEEGEKELERVVKESNKRLKRLIYEGDDETDNTGN